MGIEKAIVWLRERIQNDREAASYPNDLDSTQRNGIESTAGSDTLDYLDRFNPDWIIRKCDADLQAVTLAEDMITNDPYDERRGGLEILEFLAQPYRKDPGFPPELDPDTVHR